MQVAFFLVNFIALAIVMSSQSVDVIINTEQTNADSIQQGSDIGIDTDAKVQSEDTRHHISGNDDAVTPVIQYDNSVIEIGTNDISNNEVESNLHNDGDESYREIALVAESSSLDTKENITDLSTNDSESKLFASVPIQTSQESISESIEESHTIERAAQDKDNVEEIQQSSQIIDVDVVRDSIHSSIDENPTNTPVIEMSEILSPTADNSRDNKNTEPSYSKIEEEINEASLSEEHIHQTNVEDIIHETISNENDDDYMHEILELQRLEEEEEQLQQNEIKLERDNISTIEDESTMQARQKSNVEATFASSSGASRANVDSTHTQEQKENYKQTLYNTKRPGTTMRPKQTLNTAESNQNNRPMSGGTTKFNIKSNNIKLDSIDDLISRDTQNRASEEKSQAGAAQRGMKDDYNRNRVQRKYARPVERTLNIYKNPKTTLYQVLGVSENVDTSDLKRVYRNAALIIHPDKNPHPDAKNAFDAIQEAFVTLSSPIKRIEYDKLIKRKGKPSLKKIQKKLYHQFNNIWSRIQYSIYRFQKGEMKEDIDELFGEDARKAKVEIHKMMIKFVDVASPDETYERLHLLSEIYFDNFPSIMKICTFISLLSILII